MRDLAWWEMAFLSLVVATLALHVALHIVGATPDQFVRFVGRALLPDLSGL